ncbi:hypothetical protein JCM9279_001821 [Rhodotorula babjevae]
MRAEPPPAHTPDPRRAPAPLDPPQPRPLPEHLHDLAHSLTRKLDDLDAYQVPQLAHCQGPLAFHHELAAAVRSELAGCRRDIEEFKLEVDDLERARDRAAATPHVQALQQRIDSSTKLYRQAVVASKRQIDAYGHLAARDELLAPGADSSGRASPGPYGPQGGSRARSPQPNQSADDALMSATSDVTEGLRRTLQLMQQEVDRSLVSNELLESQTKTMELTSNQYSTLSSLLHTSRALITALERSAVLDRLVLFGAFAFFAAVCAHIFKKRVIDRGVHVLGAVGSVVGAVGRRAGAGAAGAAVVDKAGEVVEAAGGAVKDEAKGEIARAAAAAGALAGAAWRGAEALRARAFPQDAGEGETGEEERELAHEVVPAREEGEGRVRTEPAQPSAKVDAEAGTADVFYEAPELVDDMPAPTTTAEPLPLPTAEPAPAAPSPSLAAPHEPAHQLPLDADITSRDDLDALETGDADLPDEAAPPPPAAAETVALRDQHPPAPSLDAQHDVAFESVSAHGAEPEPTPDAQAQDEPSSVGAVAEDDERVFQPLERLRPTRPDLDAQLGDVQGIVDAHTSEPAAAAPEADELDEVLPIVEKDAALELDEQAQDSSITALQPSSASQPVEDEPAAAIELPALSDEDSPSPALELDLADAEEAQHVAEAHAGGEGGTRVPEADELREGGLPPLDVDGEGAPGFEQEAPEEVALPIDLEKEQTVWERDEEDESEAERVAAEQDEEEVRAEQSDEALLDEMLEAQLGGMVGGATQHVVGSVTANGTALSEPVDAVAQEQDEPANADPAPSEAPLPEAPAAYDDFPLDDTTSLVEPPAAIPEDAPTPASTAATTAEPTPAPTDSALYDAVDPITTAEPTISAAPVAASELDGAELGASDEEITPPPAAEAEESVEPAQLSSTGAPVEPDDGSSMHDVLDEEEEEEPDVGADELVDGSEDGELVAPPIEADDVPLVLDDQGGDDAPVYEGEASRDEEDEVASAFFEDGDEQGQPAAPLDVELPLHEAEEEYETFDGHGSAGEGEGDEELELEEGDLAAAGQVEHEAVGDDAAPALEASLPVAHDVEDDSGEYALSHDALDADVANSDVVFPDSSIDEDDAVDSSAPLSPSIDADADAGDDSGAVFEMAADEAISDHVGEQAPSSGHGADTALHRAEDILDELEHEYEDGEEYYEGEEEGEYERYEGEEEGEPYYEEEEAEAPAQRDEL